MLFEAILFEVDEKRTSKQTSELEEEGNIKYRENLAVSFQLFLVFFKQAKSSKTIVFGDLHLHKVKKKDILIGRNET